MRNTKKILTLVTSLLLLTLAKLPVQAQQVPGNHPGYIHALTYLRNAHWLLTNQPGDAKVYEGEAEAAQQVDSAIREIKAASIDDGKDINTHLNFNTPNGGSRLARAIENLQDARAAISGEEDNPQARELRHRCFDHIDNALKAAGKAHTAWMKQNQ